MRYILIILTFLIVACEEDPSFYKEDIDFPKLDSILERQEHLSLDSFYLFGRSSGNRDNPVFMFFYTPDSAEEVRFYRSTRFDALGQYREFFPEVTRTQDFWQTSSYPLYDGDLFIRASYMVEDTMYLSKSLKLLHWGRETADIPDIDIDTRNPRNPRFKWDRDEYGSDIYLLGISDRNEDMLSSVILADTNYRFYDVFAPFDFIGPEYTQPELVEGERYNIHLMGIDTVTGWSNSYRQVSFISTRE